MEIAFSRTFNMVLTDINMPNMTGIRHVSKLRRLKTYQDIPIVMVTTKDKDFKKQKAWGKWLVAKTFYTRKIAKSCRGYAG